MKRLNIKNLFLALMVLCIAVIAGCSKNDESDSAKEETEAAAKTVEKLAVNTDIQEKLKNLGFITYKNPSDVPYFEVPGLEDGKFTSNELKGKITILNFWAPWCPPCRDEMPLLQAFYDDFKDKKNFQLITTSIHDSRQNVKDFMAKNKYTIPVYLDENVTATMAFIPQGIPITYIVNKDGKILADYSGKFNFSKAEFKALIEELIK